jgi:hypothetical protein
VTRSPSFLGWSLGICISTLPTRRVHIDLLHQDLLRRMFISGSPTSGLSVFPIGSFCSAVSSVVSRLFVLLPSSDVNRSLVDLIDLFLNTPWVVPLPGRTAHSYLTYPHTYNVSYTNVANQQTLSPRADVVTRLY